MSRAERFVLMEFAGKNHFHLHFMRYTGAWVVLYRDLHLIAHPTGCTNLAVPDHFHIDAPFTSPGISVSSLSIQEGSRSGIRPLRVRVQAPQIPVTTIAARIQSTVE